MAKKKNYPILPSESPPMPDNNPASGLAGMPNNSLNGCLYPEGKKLFFDAIDAGESVNKPDVVVNTANGIASSFGKNKDRQYNWGGNSGKWNDNEFDDSNLTGM